MRLILISLIYYFNFLLNRKEKKKSSNILTKKKKEKTNRQIFLEHCAGLVLVFIKPACNKIKKILLNKQNSLSTFLNQKKITKH